jgi:hypothetical protein
MKKPIHVIGAMDDQPVMELMSGVLPPEALIDFLKGEHSLKRELKKLVDDCSGISYPSI